MLHPPTGSAVSPSSQSNEAGAEFRRQLRTVYQHKWLIAFVVAVSLTATYFWTKRQPRAYQADCTIEYDPNPIRPLRQDMDGSGPEAYWTSRESFATQNLILTSRALSERVVRKLGLHQNPAFMGVEPARRRNWKGGDVVSAATMLQGRISVHQERDTRIVHIRITDEDPERAMVLANAIAEAYLEKTMQDRLGSTTGALEWLSDQLGSLKTQLETSELSLHEFVKEEANLSMPFGEQQRLVSNDILRFSERLGAARMQRIEAAARLQALELSYQNDPLSFVLPEGANGEDKKTIAALRATYYGVAAKRDALAVEYGDQHPEIRGLNAELTTLKAQLQREIDGYMTTARAQLKELESVETGLRAALQEANRAGMSLNLKEITYRRLERERDNAGKLYGTILERTAETDLTHALQVSFVRIVDRALKPSFAIYPSYRRNLIAGGLLGLLLGIAIAFVLGQLDRVIRTVENAEALGLTILGIMPKIEVGAASNVIPYGRRLRKNAPERVANRDLVVHTHPKSSVAECCRTIRTNLTFMTADRPQRAIVVTSPNPREGKTTVTLSLAISLAQGGKRVLIVDSDLRKPRVHKAMGRSNARGVTTVLVGEHQLEDALQSTDISGLDLLASGPIPPNPAELLHTKQFGELVVELSRRYDHVLFDSPPLAAVTDAAIIAPQVDGVILVVHAQRTTRDALRSALRQLRDVTAHITGGVLNDVDLASRQYGYGSYYYYHNEGYYQADEGAREKVDLPAAES